MAKTYLTNWTCKFSDCLEDKKDAGKGKNREKKGKSEGKRK